MYMLTLTFQPPKVHIGYVHHILAWPQGWILEKKGKLGVHFSQKSVLEKYFLDSTFNNFQTKSWQKLGIILENKVSKKCQLKIDFES